MYDTATAYPLLRASLDPAYAELADEQLDALVAQLYGAGVAAEDVESFWRDVGRGFSNVARGVGNLAQQAAPVLQRALPSIAQGALTGASVGGPFGAIAGAVAGGAGGVLSQSRNPALRGIGGAIGGVGQLVGQATPAGALGSLASVGLGALGRQGGPAGALGRVAGQLAPQVAGALRGGGAHALLGMLARPETLRALSAAAMGPYGRPQVNVGAQPVPVQSILGALGQVAGRAAAEAESAGEQVPAYFYGADGELAVDPADAEQRADALLELFAHTPAPQYAFAPPPARRAWEPEYTDADAAYDEWLLATEEQWPQEHDHA